MLKVGTRSTDRKRDAPGASLPAMLANAARHPFRQLSINGKLIALTTMSVATLLAFAVLAISTLATVRRT